MMRISLLSLVLLVFSALTIEATAAFGYIGVFEAMAENSATRLGFLDLSLSLGLVLLWMREDASGRGLPFWPYAAITLAVGVAGPLAYLIHRELRGAHATGPQRA